MEVVVQSPAQLSYVRRKRVVLAAVIMISIIAITLLILPSVRADSDFKNTYNSYKELVIGEISGGMLDTINQLFVPTTTVASTKINSLFGGVKTALETNTFYENAARALQGVGMFLCVLYSFIVLFRELQRGDGSMEMWTKVFSTLLIGLVVVLNWKILIEALEGLGALLVSQITNNVNTIDAQGLSDTLNTVFDFGATDLPDDPSIFNGSLWTWIEVAFSVGLKFVGLTVLFLIFEIPLIIGRIVLLTILLELTIRKVFFPIALADVAGNGMRSPGVSYMKKFLALYIRIAMCYIIAITGNIMMNSAISVNIGTETVFTVLLRFSVIAIMYVTCTKLYTATSAIANQVIGS